MNRILFDPSEVDAANRVVVVDDRARHIRDVLGAPDRPIRIGLLDGPKGQGTIVRNDANGLELACEFEADVPARPGVTLVLAVPRPKVMRRLWAPLAMLGVRRVVLVNASRVERYYFDTHWLEETTYRPLLVEGLQQAGDTRVPEVLIRRRLRPFLQDELAHLDADFSYRMILDPRRAKPAAWTQLHPGQRGVIALGPEGGWQEFELELFCEIGFTAVTLGERVLRSDIACIAALTLAQQATQVPGKED